MIDAIVWYTGLDARQSAGGVRPAAPSARLLTHDPGIGNFGVTDSAGFENPSA
jgi:hypothetical protein